MNALAALDLLPKSVQRYLTRASISIADCALLNFDEAWQYLGAHGDLQRFDLHQLAAPQMTELFKALCIGLHRLKGAELKYVGLPNGKSVDLHLFAGPNAVHILLLDVQDSVEQTRAWQQSAQESELRSYEKTRQLRSHKLSSAELKKHNAELRLALETERAKVMQLRHELFANLRSRPSEGNARGLEHMARAFERYNGLPPVASLAESTLDDIKSALTAMLAAQIHIEIKGPADRLIQADVEASASALLPLLMFAHRRTAVNTPALSAQLSSDSDAIRIQVYCGTADLSAAESDLLWKRLLPANRALTPVEIAALLIAERLSEVAGRLTRGFDAATGLRLTASVPIRIADLGVVKSAASTVTKVDQSLFAQKLWVIGLTEQQQQILRAAIAQSGVEQLSFASVAEAPTLDGRAGPICVLLNLDHPQSGKYAYSAKAAGYAGRIVGIGAHKLSGAVMTAFSQLLTSDTNSEQLRSALLGSK